MSQAESNPAAEIARPFQFSLRTIFVAVAIAVPLLFVYSCFVNFRVFPEVVPKPFDQNEWKAWSIEDMRQSKDIRRHYARRDMVDNLLQKYDFSGWTEAELTKLMGPSNPDFCPKEWDVAYLVGSDWVDYVVLVFRLHKDGTVASYQVIMI
jgi:hypothetical protein